MSTIKLKSRRTINHYHTFCLRLTGIWPNDNYAICLRIVWAFVFTLTISSEFYYFYMHFSIKKLLEFMEDFGTALNFVGGFLKLIIIWYKSRTFQRIINTITEDWNDCATSNFDWVSCIMNKNTLLCYRCTRLVMFSFVLSLIIYGIGFLISSSKDQLIIAMALPFDVNSSTNRKIILLVQYVWITLYDTTLFGNIMSLVLTLVIHLGGQLDIISHAIENISTLSEKSESVGLKIRSLISKHQRIISMSDDIEALFTYVLLVHFLFNILIICSVGFAIAAALRTNQGTVVVVKLIAYYCVLIMEAFIYCYAGEYLNNKSSGFGDTAYKSEWYNLKAKESRMLVLLVLRSQKSLCLTIGKFMDLSFARFTSIMKLSVSYISVLLAVY